VHGYKALPEIRLVDVEHWIGNEVIIRRVSLELQGPGLVQVIGPNGAGKTTILRIMAGLLRPTSGRVIVDGEDITGDPSRAGKRLGYVPQRPPVSRFNPITVKEFVSSRALFTRRWPRLRDSTVESKVREVLETVGLSPETWDKKLTELSGGQLMRAFIARTLIHNPDILLLDEPLSPVDPVGRAGLARLLTRISQDRLVVVTSHDPILLLHHTKTIVLMNRGVAAYGPPSEVLKRDLLRRVYGEAVVEVEHHFHISDYHAG
jgi:zinc/manganese transport system ATP-binding protein